MIWATCISSDHKKEMSGKWWQAIFLLLAMAEKKRKTKVAAGINKQAEGKVYCGVKKTLGQRTPGVWVEHHCS